VSAGEPEEERPSLVRIDENAPSVARAYSYLLGGKELYEADRRLIEFMRAVMKDPARIAITNREWLIRAVRWLAGEAGIRQFLDCGSGLPTDENVHQVAQRTSSDATVVYADNDPTVQAHGRALLADNDHTAFLGADLAQPEQVLAHPTVRRMLDFDEPIALIQCATLHHVSDDPRPVREVMAAYVEALPPGSYLALTHVVYPPDTDDPTGSGRALAGEMKQRMRTAGMDSGHWRSHDEVLSFFDGMRLLDPGLVRAAEWWPDGPPTLHELDYIIYGGVGRKP
jgi:hypothetical protein